jgi:hypothetical protein
MTTDYLSILRQFALLSFSHSTDQETQNRYADCNRLCFTKCLSNRTRLIGLAALTAAVNSEALYNDIGHFGTQASIILRPILTVLFDTPISVLDEQYVSAVDWNDFFLIVLEPLRSRIHHHLHILPNFGHAQLSSDAQRPSTFMLMGTKAPRRLMFRTSLCTLFSHY